MRDAFSDYKIAIVDILESPLRNIAIITQYCQSGIVEDSRTQRIIDGKCIFTYIPNVLGNCEALVGKVSGGI